MSVKLLETIAAELGEYIEPEQNGISPKVVFGNIADAKDNFMQEEESILEKIVISIVNVAEEASIKNEINQRKGPNPNQIIDFYPVVNINLFLLFSCNFANYLNAVSYQFKVIEFFQGKKIFTLGQDLDEETGLQSEITLDLHTLSFEQLNDLWGSLGGRQMPFVLYRARMIHLEHRIPRSEAKEIQSVKLDGKFLKNT